MLFRFIGWSKFLAAADASTARPRIVSCYPRGGDATAAFALRHSLERFDLNCHIEPIETQFSDRVLCFEKAEFMMRMWNKYREPLLFVEAGAVLREAPLLPSFLGCDVALHKWNRWEMSARTLYEEAATHCHAVKDYVTRDLFEKLMHDEEEHIDFLETQLDLVAKLGVELYAQHHIGKLDDDKG